MYYEVLNEYLKCEKDQILKYFNEAKLVSLKEKNEKKVYTVKCPSSRKK